MKPTCHVIRRVEDWRGARMGPSPAPRRLERRERISRTPLSCLPYAECGSRDSRTVRAEGGDRRGSPRPGETLSGRRSKRLESVPSTLPGDRQPSAPVFPVQTLAEFFGFLKAVVRNRAIDFVKERGRWVPTDSPGEGSTEDSSANSL